MNHQPYREWIELGLSDELSAQERLQLETHLVSCAECRTVREEIQSLHATVTKNAGVEVTESLLMEARQQFRVALRHERTKVSAWQKVTEFVNAVFAPPMKLAAGGAFMLALGFLGGYMMFSGQSSQNGNSVTQQMTDETELTRGESQVANVKFIDGDPSDGSIEFSFDAITPVQVKGSPNDPGVQNLLVKALTNEENPGVRLRAVSAMTSPMVNIQFGNTDDQVKTALITAMKRDENPGVRKEALKALSKMPFDEDIKQGLISVLSNDKNEGMRVDAINVLSSAKGELKSTDEELLDMLRQKIESDNNGYVRLRARAVLQEVRQ
ncbi:MAG TPA: HEAT repeat domain-containing protein [Bacteroidota bacterium]